MILGDFNSWASEKHLFSPAISEALEYLRSLSLQDIPEGEYRVKDDGRRLIVRKVDTKPYQEQRPEKHENFIDIHFLITGEEKMGYARDTGRNSPIHVSPAIEDHTFFDQVEYENEVILYPGQFVLFMPSDLHRPWCRANPNSPTVKKALLKLPLASLI